MTTTSAASLFGCGKLCKQTGEIEADLASTWLPQVCKSLSLTFLCILTITCDDAVSIRFTLVMSS